MKTAASLLALCAIAGLMMLNAPQQADARPKYLAVFLERYEKAKPEVEKLGTGTKRCVVCHKDGADKKKRSEFGEALKKALGEKPNVMDQAKINAAFDAVEKEKYEGDKTYGELLKEGKLPPPYKAEEEK